MVELAEIDEQVAREIEQVEIPEDDNDDQFEDEAEQIVLYEDDFLDNESLLERLGALVDIVPPTFRQQVVNSAYTSVSLGFTLGKTVGSAAWIISTALLLVYLPLSLELERDSMALQLENQMRG